MPVALLALLPQIIALIPTITSGVSNLVKFISDIRAAASQTSEWTPDLEKQFMDALIARASSEAWKTDSELSR